MGLIQTATSDLTGLYSIFGVEGKDVPYARFISADEMPEPFRGLLAHDEHMTVTMEKHHGTPVDIEILKSIREGDRYARKILLRLPSTNQVVQFGIMRFDLGCVDREIQYRILEGRIPLGRILIEQGILRRISTHALLKITPTPSMRELFGMKPPDESDQDADAIVYGRLATIFCDDQPAVDLLEVASPFS